MSNQLKESVDTVIFRLESFMREADFYKSTPTLHMNADARLYLSTMIGKQVTKDSRKYRTFEKIILDFLWFFQV